MTERSEKLRKTMIAKYGSEEAWKEKLREAQAKSRINYKGTGGFKALSPERRREVARLGGKAGGRGRGKNEQN